MLSLHTVLKRFDTEANLMYNRYMDKSKGHLLTTKNSEYYEAEGNIFRAPINCPIMPDGYRCGRWECYPAHWPVLLKLLVPDKLARAAYIVARAERDLGLLTAGQATDLLLDNMQDLKGSDESRALVESLNEQHDRKMDRVLSNHE